MPWLLRDGEVLASLDIARTRREWASRRSVQETIEGALLLPPTRSVHTFGLRQPIDVAFCEAELDVDDELRDLVVVKTVRMGRWRVSLPSIHPRAVVEAEAGTFGRWNLSPGDQLEIKQ